nr:MAG TPA: hypothetical protein [Herelleviridae sp.]
MSAITNLTFGVLKNYLSRIFLYSKNTPNILKFLFCFLAISTSLPYHLAL